MTDAHHRRRRYVFYSSPSCSVLSRCTCYRCVLIFFCRHRPKITNTIKFLNISRHMILLLSLTLFCVYAYDDCCQTKLQRRSRIGTSKMSNPLPLCLYLPFCPLPLSLPSLSQILGPSEKLLASRRWTLLSRYANMNCLGVVFVETRDVRMSI